MLEEPMLPFHFQLASTAIATLRGMGLPLASLQPEQLLRTARKRCGLFDVELGSLEQEALARLCWSAENDGDLHPLGRVGVHDMIVTALVNRLLWVRQRSLMPDELSAPAALSSDWHAKKRHHAAAPATSTCG